jgi:cytosine/creatinine deaminase
VRGGALGVTAGERPATLRGLRLPGANAACDLELSGGRIAAVSPSDEAARGVCLPAFCDLHVHADRAFVAGPRPPRSLSHAIAMAREVRARSSEEEITARAHRLLDRCLAHGSLRVRSHADTDPVTRLRPIRGLVRARAERVAGPELEIVAFANSDLDPASVQGRRLLVEAIEGGADLVGGVVAYHPSPQRSIDAILELAGELEVRADLHIDENAADSGLWLAHLATRTTQLGLEGRVTAGHCCALASADPGLARQVVEAVAVAGITVIALPALNLWLQDRGSGTPRHRGVTLVRELLRAGVEVRFASDNVRDAFFPFGDADPLETAYLAAITAQIDEPEVLVRGICDGRLAPQEGDRGDLVVIPGVTSIAEAIAIRPEARMLISDGLVVTRSPRPSPEPA